VGDTDTRPGPEGRQVSIPKGNSADDQQIRGHDIPGDKLLSGYVVVRSGGRTEERRLQNPDTEARYEGSRGVRHRRGGTQTEILQALLSVAR